MVGPAGSPLGRRASPLTPMASETPVLGQRGVDVYFPSRDRYLRTIADLRDGGRDLLIDLCAVDYLLHPGRTLPDGVLAERFEVAVVLRSTAGQPMVRVRVQVPDGDPTIGSLSGIYAGAAAMEREAFDMMGIRFVGHPDLTRILMPDDWEGHPLRKDYGVGRVPVQFKEAPGPR
jgi:NADH-quinone oxidoreductase subunit C